MPKTPEQLRKIDPEELTAHDFVTLVVLAGFAANPNRRLDYRNLVSDSRATADEFFKQREEAQ